MRMEPITMMIMAKNQHMSTSSQMSDGEIGYANESCCSFRLDHLIRNFGLHLYKCFVCVTRFCLLCISYCHIDLTFGFNYHSNAAGCLCGFQAASCNLIAACTQTQVKFAWFQCPARSYTTTTTTTYFQSSKSQVCLINIGQDGLRRPDGAAKRRLILLASS